MALESVPPLMLVSLRFTTSGAVLLIVAFFVKAHFPSGKELFYTALFGVIIIGLGNGCVAFAELWIPSGLAPLFITTAPFWMIGIEALTPGGARLHGPTLVGMLVGFAGTLLLVAPTAIQQGLSGPIVQGFLLLQFGCCGWGFGLVLAGRRHAASVAPHRDSTGPQRSDSAGVSIAAVRLLWLGLWFDPAAPPHNQGPPGGERRGAATGDRSNVTWPGAPHANASDPMDRPQLRSCDLPDHLWLGDRLQRLPLRARPASSVDHQHLQLHQPDCCAFPGLADLSGAGGDSRSRGHAGYFPGRDAGEALGWSRPEGCCESCHGLTS